MLFQYFNINQTINETSCLGKIFCTFEYFTNPVAVSERDRYSKLFFFT